MIVTSRWAILALCFVTLFGPYYCFDNPASNLNALKRRFHVPIVSTSSTDPHEKEIANEFNVNYGLLYSLYSFPNMVLPMISGVLIDKYGIPRMVIVLISAACFGQLLFTGGTLFRSWGMMLVGRAVYGAGCESLYVTQTTILAQWFKGSSMSLALALLVVSTRSASVVNSVVGPDMPSPQFAFLVGLFLCLTSWISAAILVHAHKSLHHGKRGKDDSTEKTRLLVLEDVAREASTPSQLSFAAVTWQQTLRQIVTDIFTMPRMYWIVCVTCGLGFPSIGSLSDIAPAYLSRYNMMKHIDESQQIQNLEFAAMNGVVIVFAPFAGWLADRVRKYRWFMGVSMTVAAAMFVFGAVYPDMPPLSMMLVSSLSLAFFAAGIWPTVSLLVPHDQQGTAFGLFVAIQNAGNGAGAAVVSAMQPPRCHDSFRCSTAILAVMAGLAALLGFLVVVPRRKASVDVTVIESDSGGLAAPLLMDDMVDDGSDDVNRNTDFADRVAQRVMSDDSHEKRRRRTDTKSKSTSSRQSRASIGLGNGTGFFVVPDPEP